MKISFNGENMYRIIYKYKPSLNVEVFKLQRKYNFLGLIWWRTLLKTAKLFEVKQWAIKYDCRDDVRPIVKFKRW